MITTTRIPTHTPPPTWPPPADPPTWPPTPTRRYPPAPPGKRPHLEGTRTRRRTRDPRPTRDFIGNVNLTRVEGFYYKRRDLEYRRPRIKAHEEGDLAPHWLTPGQIAGAEKKDGKGGGPQNPFAVAAPRRARSGRTRSARPSIAPAPGSAPPPMASLGAAARGGRAPRVGGIGSSGGAAPANPFVSSGAGGGKRGGKRGGKGGKRSGKRGGGKSAGGGGGRSAPPRMF